MNDNDDPKSARAARLAEALRANLRKRKAQGKTRGAVLSQDTHIGDDTEGHPGPDNDQAE